MIPLVHFSYQLFWHIIFYLANRQVDDHSLYVDVECHITESMSYFVMYILIKTLENFNSTKSITKSGFSCSMQE